MRGTTGTTVTVAWIAGNTLNLCTYMRLPREEWWDFSPRWLERTME